MDKKNLIYQKTGIILYIPLALQNYIYQIKNMEISMFFFFMNNRISKRWIAKDKL